MEIFDSEKNLEDELVQALQNMFLPKRKRVNESITIMKKDKRYAMRVNE